MVSPPLSRHLLRVSKAHGLLQTDGRERNSVAKDISWKGMACIEDVELATEEPPIASCGEERTTAVEGLSKKVSEDVTFGGKKRRALNTPEYQLTSSPKLPAPEKNHRCPPKT
jgi:hypothetical protein